MRSNKRPAGRNSRPTQEGSRYVRQRTSPSSSPSEQQDEVQFLGTVNPNHSHPSRRPTSRPRIHDEENVLPPFVGHDSQQSYLQSPSFAQGSLVPVPEYMCWICHSLTSVTLDQEAHTLVCNLCGGQFCERVSNERVQGPPAAFVEPEMQSDTGITMLSFWIRSNSMSLGAAIGGNSIYSNGFRPLSLNAIMDMRNVQRGEYFFDPTAYAAILEEFLDGPARDADHAREEPATKEAIASLRHVKVTEDNLKDNMGDCFICQEEVAVDSDLLYFPCKHKFHKDCIQPWLEKNHTCPTCRYALNANASSVSSLYNRSDEDSVRRSARRDLAECLTHSVDDVL